MKVSDLNYDLPHLLIAKEPQYPPRVMSVDGRAILPQVSEQSWREFLNDFQKGDLIVVNNTKVVKRRVFSEDQREILFLQSQGDGQRWQVLMPAKGLALGDKIMLPGQIEMTFVERGLPQICHLSQPVDFSYFEAYGEVPLPPYIQDARHERHASVADESWYQTEYAKIEGSAAAPTAGLHFKAQDLKFLRAKGVRVAEVTLHVGMGTFLPVKAEVLEDHNMHSEYISVPKATIAAIEDCRANGGRVYGVGTTVARTLESIGRVALQESQTHFYGWTNLYILPGFEFRFLDSLVTNFHQPQSTLLALVASFSDLETLKRAYSWAMTQKFRFLSYGDVSVWHR
jgi:S-adenosylmethionine:tRNA ribosyltransferase-isomerase